MTLDNLLFAARLGQSNLSKAVNDAPDADLRPLLTAAVARLEEATQADSFE